MKEPKIEKYYTSREVAELLHKNPATILRYLRKGDLLGVKVGNSWRIPYRSVAKILQLEHDPVGGEGE